MYVFNRKLYSLSMYFLLPVLCSFMCIQQVMCTPTVAPCKTFNATMDARTLCNMRGNLYPETIEKTSRMLCHRTIDERIKVKKEFEKIKDDQLCMRKDIAEYLCSSDYLSEYKKLIQTAFKSEYKIYLDDFANTFKNVELIDTATEIEILLSIQPKGKAKFKEDYNKAGYSPSFDEGLDELKGDIGNVIKELSKRERQEEKPVDQEQAQKDADSLNAERKKWGNHRDDLDRILMETPIKQLNATLFQFKQRHGKSLEQLIEEKMKDDGRKRDAYKDLINYGYNPVDYYARRLDDSFKAGDLCIGNVNRIIVIHSGTNLVEIAAAFQANTQRSLIDVIKENTGWDTEDLLCCLAGETGFEET